MANITVELTSGNKLRISFAGRQAQHLRLSGKWTDWMLAMDDFRDLLIPIRNGDIDMIITALLNGCNKISFSHTSIGQEYRLSDDKKIVRRAGPGATRAEYQSVALFIKNDAKIWPPQPVEIEIQDLMQLLRAMITLDRPRNHCVKDSMRNMQYLLAILWVKKMNPRLLQGSKKPKANEIFRISLVK